MTAVDEVAMLVRAGERARVVAELEAESQRPVTPLSTVRMRSELGELLRLIAVGAAPDPGWRP